MLNLTKLESIGVVSTILSQIDFNDPEDVKDCINIMDCLLNRKQLSNQSIQLLKFNK